MTSYELHAAKSIWKHGSRRCFSKFLMQSILCRHSSKTIVVWYTLCFRLRGEGIDKVRACEGCLWQRITCSHRPSNFPKHMGSHSWGRPAPGQELDSMIPVVPFYLRILYDSVVLWQPAWQLWAHLHPNVMDLLQLHQLPSVTCPSPGTHILAHPAVFEIAHSHLPGA